MPRVCFTFNVSVEHLDVYKTAHQNVWPEMREALSAAGWSDYSLFLRESDGLIVGYLVTDDFEAAQARMSATDVNTRWQQEMAKLAGGRPDDNFVVLEEVFHLE
ncbi:L-rhamnose mutarotase [Conexibacter sp. JD483]|uniref:L-rhamnose mutarotase n=1 Tax=unclassified Conexibacter TaxID=2627773 RepID=UPI0027253719|nr:MULTISPECIES: L-rhamnose mutarotase [unclassified Conexibacter]MDO8184965.1 L-rhamnose mutarotase [Conexibacter sp. CPCC 205706]MDO8198109.1 L-rhamnose mutarotase [Conexibacter sp. CPCC 205762]MDR9368269.1 L-rhamnose mutarotase [Conexibacter sp. JD483]